MQLILLPGMDGTGILFKGLLSNFSSKLNIQIVTYPTDKILSYTELTEYVTDRLPVDEDYMILAESYSGQIAYKIAQKNLPHLKKIIFVASFLQPPTAFVKILSYFPLRILFKLPIPALLIRFFALGNNADKTVINLFRSVLKKVSTSVLAARVWQIAKIKTQNKTITIPCLYIQAKQDKLVPATNMRQFQSICSRLKTIKIAGPHLILKAKPAECAAVIEREVYEIGQENKNGAEERT